MIPHVPGFLRQESSGSGSASSAQPRRSDDADSASSAMARNLPGAASFKEELCRYPSGGTPVG